MEIYDGAVGFERELHSIHDARILYEIENREEKAVQVEPEFDPSLVAIVAVVLIIGVALCVGIAFYYKGRSSSKEASANQVNPISTQPIGLTPS
jgi:hypothetical protein